MVSRISNNTKKELIGALRERYQLSTKKEKTRILDDFRALTGYHRKHAVRLLGGHPVNQQIKHRYSRRIYNEAVREALIVIWEVGDRICGKRLKAILPTLLDSMEHHGHLQLDPQVRRCLCQASASAIDRLLRPIREEAKPKKKRGHRPKKVSNIIRVRTFSDWDNPPPGYLEIDSLDHNGGSTAGTYIHSFGAVDICSAWVECVPLLAKASNW